MDTTTDLQPWRVIAEFVGLDEDDDDDVVEALAAVVEDLLRLSSSDLTTTIEAVVAGDSVEEAVFTVVDALRSAVPAAALLRLVDPLASVTDIAEEAGVTRQAARNWALGLRQSGFPRPLAIVGDGIRVWRQADVDGWLTQAMKLGTGHRFPSAAFVADFNENPGSRGSGVALEDDSDGEWTVASEVTEVQSGFIERSSTREKARASAGRGR